VFLYLFRRCHVFCYRDFSHFTGDLAQGEGYQEINTFILTSRDNDYVISRGWGSINYFRTITISRSNLPTGCTFARFFLNDIDHELKVGHGGTSNWENWERPPLPDDSYPPCTLLITLGTFSRPPVFNGVAVTSSAGLVAKDDIAKPQPVAWLLLPAEIVVDTYLFIGAGAGAIVTMPILLPYASYKNNELKKKMDELPPSIKACKIAIDEQLDKNGSPYSEAYTTFSWFPIHDNSYVDTKVDELFSDNEPIPIDSRVVLYKGNVNLLSHPNMLTDAEGECGLQSGKIVATRVNVLK
jgi:hypothetical protein